MSGQAATGAATAPRKLTRVAVGVLVRPDGALLVADRPEGKPYPGYWEFPGGKIEAGESVHAALARELHEELGIRIARSWPWTTLEHHYPHAHVRLHFRRIDAFEGEPVPREGQRLRWLAPDEDPPQPLLPAAVPALRWARVPACIGWMQGRLEQLLPRVDTAIERGLRVLVAPAPASPDPTGAWMQALTHARSRSVRLLAWTELPGVLPDCDGLVLGGPALQCAKSRPAGGLCGASISDLAGLEHAARLGMDFAVCAGGALRTLAGQPGLAPLPLLALEPAAVAALRDIWSAGGHGLALDW